MTRSRLTAGGGFSAIIYVLRKAYEAGGLFKLYHRLRSKNACKTCALGMGGQKGGMVNESGHFPEVCKKSVQAQVADMHGEIPESFFQKTSIKQFEQMTSQTLENLGRLTFPVIAEENDTKYRRISWKEALDRTAMAFGQASPQEVFFYVSGRSSNEAAFLTQLVGRIYGTANIHNCSFYCHQASGVALNMVYGSGTASVILEDLSKSDLAIIAGANPASNHPRLMSQLMHLRRRGGKVIVINPLKELGLVRFKVPSDWRSLLFGTNISDLYLQPNIGSDTALFKAILKGILEAGGENRDFIKSYTSGWETLETDLNSVSWEALINTCGVSLQHIQEAVKIILNSKNAIFMWAMGLTHHTNGVDNILSFANIAMARGWLGKEGCGLLPLRGHSNVQGIGTVGVAPELKKAFAKNLENLYGIKVPDYTGQDTYASMLAASEGHIKAALLLGGNLFASNPDREWAGKALSNIPFTVSLTTKLNEGHFHGRSKTSILLPVLARDEESQVTSQESMFNFIRFSEGGKPSIHGEMLSEIEIIASIAEKILPDKGFNWYELQSNAQLRKMISQTVPGLEAMENAEDKYQEFQVSGRTFHKPLFLTQDQKAHFYVTPLPDFMVGPDEFRLMTLRSEGQFNSVVYEEEDLYRGNLRRDVVMMSVLDTQHLMLNDGDRVYVKTEAGTMEVSVVIVDIPAGNIAMYYPEANLLVPRRLDPRSRTPAFKSVAAKIIPVSLKKPVL